ncbi:MAG: hypothetical protein PHN64_05105 [Desulfovibrionaceae bacterium]|nr:hypothetical protein [Desulfovibrionaceae bacterium]
MSQVTNSQNINSIMNNIDLGPTQSVQLMFAKLQLAQSEICKNQANEYMNEITQIQDKQKECAEMISRARELQNKAKADGGTTEMPADMVKYFNDNGLAIESTGDDNLHNKDEWDYNLKSLTNFQEQIGTKTQTLMVYLQDFIGQYNSYLQGANTAIKDSNQTLQSIIAR